jgi:WD40 repeat protein
MDISRRATSAMVRAKLAESGDGKPETIVGGVSDADSGFRTTTAHNAARNRRRRRLPQATAGALLVVAVVAATTARAQELPAKVTYVDHIQPIFRQHCFACHGPDQQKNDLALNSFASVIKGGASGEVVFAGDPDSSYLWSLVNHESEPAMPPGGAAKLPQPELDLIRAWIAGGLLEQGDSVARKPKRAAVAEFKPTADNRPEGEAAMPAGVLHEPVLHAPHSGAATAVAVSPWAPLAAVGAAFQISLYHTDTGALLGVLPFVEGTPYVLRFSRDGGLLLAAGGKAAAQGVAAVFDVKTGRRLATVGDELDAVIAADLSPNHELAALGGPRKTVRVYRVADGSAAYEITKHTDWITAIEFSPDGKLLATADRGGGMWLWDAATGRERGELRGHAEQITGVSWRDDSAVIASASEDDTLRTWQPDGVQIKSWGAHGGGVLSVHHAHDGQLVSAGRDQHVRTWQQDGTAVRDVAGMDDVTLAARFTTDGAKIVAADWAGSVRIYNAADGAVAATLDVNPPLVADLVATLQTQVSTARTAAEATTNELAAADSQLAAAESALNAARAARDALTQRKAEHDASLATAEQQLAAAAEQQAAIEHAAVEAAAEMTAIETELTEAQSAADAARQQRDEAAGVEAEHASAVEELVAQIAKLEELLKAARESLAPFTQALAEQEQAVATAEERIGALEARKAESLRRQAELEAISKLRAEHAGDQ